MKKLIALLLALVLSVSLFAGCGGGEGLVEGQETKDNSVKYDKSDIPEDLTLTIGLPLSTTVEDYDTNDFTLWLEEQTGYNIEFIPMQSSSTDYKAQLSAMLATDDELPDILFNIQLSKKAYEEYGESGYLLDMAPFYNDKELSASFWERMDELKALDPAYHDYVLNYLTTEEGNMYAFSRIEYSLIDNMRYMTFINQDWLDALSLDMPTNAKELEEVLIAFRDRDPNGNGKKDERPLIGASSGGIIEWLINMYVYVNDNRWFNVDENNQLYLPYLTDEYREALIWIRHLMKEGLIFNTAFSMKANEVKALVNVPKGEDQKVGIVVGHPTQIFTDGNDAVYSYEHLPYWGYAVREEQSFTPATFITQDCEYPLAAWEVFMTMCTKEGSYRLRYGNKGVHWVDADPGTKSFIGQDAEIRVLDESVWGGQNNANWHCIQGTVLINAENEACQLTDDMGEWVNQKMRIMGDCYWNYVKAEKENNPDDKYIMPKLDVDEDVSDADSNERSNTQSLIKQARADFCCGTGTYNDPTNDALWAKYVADVEAQGYKTWMEHRQVIYEAQYPERAK